MEDPANEAPASPVYYDLSFIFGSITLVLLLIMVVIFPQHIHPALGFPILPMLLIALSRISCLIGTIFSIITLVQKKQLNYFRLLWILINFLLFAIFVGSFLIDYLH